MSTILQDFLQQNPQLLQHPATVPDERPATDEPAWVERPDRYCCYCCGGSGLVRAEVMRRYINADYDSIISPPVRCNRSEACGYEKQRLADPDHGDRLLEFNRYTNRSEMPELPRPVADRIHQELKQEAKAVALSANRAELLAFARRQIQQLLKKATFDDGLLA